MNSSRGGTTGAFVSRMEEVLDVYTRPYDPNRPMVCMDETSKQLIGETRLPLPARRGRLQRYDTNTSAMG